MTPDPVADGLLELALGGSLDAVADDIWFDVVGGARERGTLASFDDSDVDYD